MLNRSSGDLYRCMNHHGEVGHRSSHHESETTVLLRNATYHTREMSLVLQYRRRRSCRVWLAQPDKTLEGKLISIVVSTGKSTCCLHHPKSSITLRAHAVLRLGQQMKTFAPCRHSSTPLGLPLHSTRNIIVSLRSFGVNFLKVTMASDHHNFSPSTSRFTVSDRARAS